MLLVWQLNLAVSTIQLTATPASGVAVAPTATGIGTGAVQLTGTVASGKAEAPTAEARAINKLTATIATGKAVAPTATSVGGVAKLSAPIASGKAEAPAAASYGIAQLSAVVAEGEADAPFAAFIRLGTITASPAIGRAWTPAPSTFPVAPTHNGGTFDYYGESEGVLNGDTGIYGASPRSRDLHTSQAYPPFGAGVSKLTVSTSQVGGGKFESPHNLFVRIDLKDPPIPTGATILSVTPQFWRTGGAGVAKNMFFNLSNKDGLWNGSATQRTISVPEWDAYCEVLGSSGLIVPETTSITVASARQAINYHYPAPQHRWPITSMGQTVQAETTDTLTAVRFGFTRRGFPSGDVYVEVYAATANDGTDDTPTGAVLATSNKVRADGISLGDQAPNFRRPQEFTFTSGPTLTSGNRYVFMVRVEYLPSSTLEEDNHYLSMVHAGMQYANGSMILEGVGEAWNTINYPTSVDMPHPIDQVYAPATPPFNNLSAQCEVPAGSPTSAWVDLDYLGGDTFESIIQAWIDDVGYSPGDPLSVQVGYDGTEGIGLLLFSNFRLRIEWVSGVSPIQLRGDTASGQADAPTAANVPGVARITGTPAEGEAEAPFAFIFDPTAVFAGTAFGRAITPKPSTVPSTPIPGPAGPFVYNTFVAKLDGEQNKVVQGSSNATDGRPPVYPEDAKRDGQQGGVNESNVPRNYAILGSRKAFVQGENAFLMSSLSDPDIPAGAQIITASAWFRQDQVVTGAGAGTFDIDVSLCSKDGLWDSPATTRQLSVVDVGVGGASGLGQDMQLEVTTSAETLITFNRGGNSVPRAPLRYAGDDTLVIGGGTPLSPDVIGSSPGQFRAHHIESVGQTVQMTATGTLQQCVFYLRRIGAPAGDVVVEVYAAVANNGSDDRPTGAVLATSNKVPGSALSNEAPDFFGAPTTFTFTGGPSLTAGNRYVFMLRVEYPLNHDHRIMAAYARTGAFSYANGSMIMEGVGEGLSRLNYPSGSFLPHRYLVGTTTTHVAAHGSTLLGQAPFMPTTGNGFPTGWYMLPARGEPNNPLTQNPLELSTLIQEWVDDVGYTPGDPLLLQLSIPGVQTHGRHRLLWSMYLRVQWALPTQTLQLQSDTAVGQAEAPPATSFPGVSKLNAVLAQGQAHAVPADAIGLVSRLTAAVAVGLADAPTAIGTGTLVQLTAAVATGQAEAVVSNAVPTITQLLAAVAEGQAVAVPAELVISGAIPLDPGTFRCVFGSESRAVAFEGMDSFTVTFKGQNRTVTYDAVSRNFIVSRSDRIVVFEKD